MNPTARDIHHVDIVPCFITALNQATASYDSPEGTIKVSWERIKEDVLLEIVAPDTMHGTVILPEEYRFQEGETIRSLKTGKYIVTR